MTRRCKRYVNMLIRMSKQANTTEVKRLGLRGSQLLLLRSKVPVTSSAQAGGLSPAVRGEVEEGWTDDVDSTEVGWDYT